MSWWTRWFGKTKKTTIDLRLEMTPPTMARLVALSGSRGLTIVEWVRRAFAVYELLRREADKGGTIIVRRRDFTEIQVKLDD